MSFLINPFAFAVAGGDFESIATVTVGSGGASYVEFTSIGSDWQHLQVRMTGLTSNTTYTADNIQVRFNTDFGNTTSNSHGLWGDGSSASATARTTGGELNLCIGRNGKVGACVIDILDYASTSKNTTVRCFGGADGNGSGYASLSSLLWRDTAAVSAVRFYPNGGTFLQHTTAALYGIKAP